MELTKNQELIVIAALVLFALLVNTLMVYIGILILCFILISQEWIGVYNIFQSWRNKVERSFASIDIIMQQREDLLPVLVQAIQKYDIHEYNAIKDTIEMRGKTNEKTPLNEKVKAAQDTETNLLKIQAVFERYPDLKASRLHESLMGKGSISKIESHLASLRLEYNDIAEKYNREISLFPGSIVASLSGFKKAEYVLLGNQISPNIKHEIYDAKKVFAME